MSLLRKTELKWNCDMFLILFHKQCHITLYLLFNRGDKAESIKKKNPNLCYWDEIFKYFTKSSFDATNKGVNNKKTILSTQATNKAAKITETIFENTNSKLSMDIFNKINIGIYKTLDFLSF